MPTVIGMKHQDGRSQCTVQGALDPDPVIYIYTPRKQDGLSQMFSPKQARKLAAAITAEADRIENA
jgi:hypothetical protein